LAIGIFICLFSANEKSQVAFWVKATWLRKDLDNSLFKAFCFLYWEESQNRMEMLEISDTSKIPA